MNDTKATVNINHNDWTLEDRNGFVIAYGIQVRNLGDGTIRIGGDLFRADELEVTSDKIVGLAGWTLTR